MATFILIGDVTYACQVSVEAETWEEAVKKAEDDGEFEVLSKDRPTAFFVWNGDDDSIEVEESE